MKVEVELPVTYSLMQILKKSDNNVRHLIHDKVFYYRDLYRHLKNRIGTVNAIKYMQDLVDIELKKQKTQEASSCKRGCNHCCHIHVTTTIPEAQLIKNRYGSFSEVQIEALEEQAQCDENTRMFAKHRACVFLKDGECSIYDYRPMACRKHYAIGDPKFCDDLTYHHRNVDLLASNEVECIVSGVLNAEQRGNMAELLLKP